MLEASLERGHGMRRITSVLLLMIGLLLLPASFAGADGPQPAELRFGDWAIDDDAGTGWLEVTWNWPDGRLAGFQFDLPGVTITRIRGGLAEEYDFTLFSSPSTALGVFSSPQGFIPPTSGEKVLVIVDFTITDYDIIRFDEVVCAEPNAQAIDVVHDDEIDPGGSPCCGDINGDGIVDGSDLTTLLGQWGDEGEGDLDGDGSIDGMDLTILLGCWGACP